MTKKSEPVEMQVAKLGIIREFNFSHGCTACVSLQQADYARILKVLREYVAEDFPDDIKYNDALNTVCSKLVHKQHRLIMLENVFLGTGRVLLDHQSGKTAPTFPVDK